MTDVEVTAEIFSKFLRMMKLKNIKTKEEIIKFEKAPRNKYK
jgi:hypothetical protein